MIEKHDYKDLCWWCRNVADSGEHKYKKADLVREFGKGPYIGANKLVRGISGELRSIQGPNSKEAKFENTLCQTCNNEKSQPFDVNYDIFTEYIRANEPKIIATRQFKFSEIYGNDWKNCRVNLLRYYVKHICCRLASAKILVRHEVISFLNGAQDLHFLKFNLEIREDIVAMMNGLKKSGMDNGCLWIGDLNHQISKSRGEISEAQSFLGYRWLRMNYLYDYSIEHTEDNFSDDLVNLDTGYNIHPETVRNWKSVP
jgi:hypothetical protein